MKHLIQYSSKVENLFFDFLKHKIDLIDLIDGLVIIENHHKKTINEPQDTEKELWFHLYKGHTAATSITDLAQDLDPSCNSQSNIEHIKECMTYGVSLESGVQIYFS